MFEEGNLLLFRPFLLKNGATPQDKFFLVLKNGIIHFSLVCLYIIKIRKDVGSREKCPTFCYKFAE